jgi:enterochelin esterase-like enzyme
MPKDFQHLPKKANMQRVLKIIKAMHIYKLVGFFFLITSSYAQILKSAFGSIRFFEKIPGASLETAIAVWLPPGYTSAKKYPVLYMHDGQMLFDAAITWNAQEWKVDETIANLIEEDSLNAMLVVGIYNRGEKRFSDYFPQKPYETLSTEEQQNITLALNEAGRINGPFRVASDAYLSFIVDELKPFVDAHFATRSDRNSTFLAGSSMGGLISLYALCRFPEVFGGIACFSTHWTGIHRNSNNPFPASMLEYVNKHLVKGEKSRRIYLDTGTETLDSLYLNHHREATELIKTKGYTASNFNTNIAIGADHSEKAWSKRFPEAVRFLMHRE